MDLASSVEHWRGENGDGGRQEPGKGQAGLEEGAVWETRHQWRRGESGGIPLEPFQRICSLNLNQAQETSLQENYNLSHIETISLKATPHSTFYIFT